jgi:threonine synthase
VAFRPLLPIAPGETPITLGEGDTPLLPLPRIGADYGIPDLWLKDEGANPTGSFKSRGMSAAITRAVAAGATRFVAPTAGNAGVASRHTRVAPAARQKCSRRAPRPSCCCARHGSSARTCHSSMDTSATAEARRRVEPDTGAFNVSTLREPYRIEGKKTLGLELAMQYNWQLPDVVIYPTGGGTGLIGMWKAFEELLAIGWVAGTAPRMFSVQSTGCAPVVRAFEQGADRCEPWADPWTIASGLRVPGPLATV